MKKLISYSLLFLFSTLSAQVKTEIDTAIIKIGEPVHLQISLPLNSGNQIHFPTWEDSLSYHIEILNRSVDTLIENEQEKVRLSLFITSFDPGDFLVRTIPVYVDSDTLYSKSFKIHVADVKIDSLNQGGFPIKDIMGEQYDFLDYWNKYWIYIAAGLLFLIILIVIIVLFIKDNFRNKNANEPQKSPYEEAKINLAELDAKKYLQKEKIKEFYSDLSFLLRKYFGRRYEFSSLELLSDDLADYLKEKEHLQEDDCIKLSEFLTDSDLAKYAKVIPTEEKHIFYRKWVEEIIEKTKPLVEEIEEETGGPKPNEVYRKRKYYYD